MVATLLWQFADKCFSGQPSAVSIRLLPVGELTGNQYAKAFAQLQDILFRCHGSRRNINMPRHGLKQEFVNGFESVLAILNIQGGLGNCYLRV